MYKDISNGHVTWLYKPMAVYTLCRTSDSTLSSTCGITAEEHASSHDLL